MDNNNITGYLGAWIIIGAICGTLYILCTECGDLVGDAFDVGLILGLILFAIILLVCFIWGGLLGAGFGLIAGLLTVIIAYLYITIHEKVSRKHRILKDSFSLKSETKKVNNLIKRRKKLLSQCHADKNQLNRISQLFDLLYIVDEKSENSALMNEDIKTTLRDLNEIEMIEKRINELGNKYLSLGNTKMAEYYRRQL